MSNTLHTMQAAMALSPVNKAMTTLENGDTFLIQEYAHEKYRMWVVASGDIPIWAGNLNEREIDTLYERYKASPGRDVWESLGIIHDSITDSQAIVAAIQHLAGHIVNLHTEIMLMKALIAKEGDSK